jgi:hypothetical protein
MQLRTKIQNILFVARLGFSHTSDGGDRQAKRSGGMRIIGGKQRNPPVPVSVRPQKFVTLSDPVFCVRNHRVVA